MNQPKNPTLQQLATPRALYYAKIAGQCAYCPQKPDHVRVTLTHQGSFLVAALCHAHAHGEADHALASGFSPDRTTGVWRKQN